MKNEEALVGEVLSDDEVREKKQAIAKWQHSPVGFGSYITKSNDLIQRTKYSLPRNEQKVLFMLMSKIDQKMIRMHPSIIRLPSTILPS